jgi:uncharacterized protein (TIGR03435 family)
VTQVVFAILAQKAAQLHGRTALTGWLYETTRFASSKFLRTKIRREAREQEACMQSSFDHPEPDQVWRQLAPHLEEAMANLGEKDRALVALRFFEYKSGAQAAAALGMREWAAHKRVARAVEKLRLFFARRGITVPAGVLIAAITAHSVQAAPAGLGPTVAAAAANGIGAGAATSTLIKGTLKLMAWAKIKTAVVVGAGLLLAGGVVTVIVEKSRAATEPDESVWTENRLDLLPPLLVLRPTKFTSADGAAFFQSGERFRGKRQSIMHLLGTAYTMGSIRMVVPASLPGGDYDYLATVPDARAALQAEIKRQLNLDAHLEQMTTNVLLLKIKSPDAPGLKPARDPAQVGGAFGAGEMKLTAYEMKYVAGNLESMVGRIVIDRTGLTNRFDVDFKWDPKNQTVEAVNSALQERLGLELVPSREAVEMLVVEKVK